MATSATNAEAQGHPGLGTPSKVEVIPLDLKGEARKLRAAGSGPPSSFQLWGVKKVPRAKFFPRTASIFGLASSDKMVEVGSKPGERGYVHSAFQQHAFGIPVENAIYRLTELDGSVVSGGGHVVPGIKNSTATINDKDARVRAFASIAATKYGDPSPPKGTLVFYSPDFGKTAPFVLTWRFSIESVAPVWDTYRVYVDATSGAIVSSMRTSWAADAVGTGITLQGAQVSLRTTALNGLMIRGFSLRESDLRKITTRDRPAGQGPIDFLDNDNNWTEAHNRRGVSAHWAAEQTWDYLQGTLHLSGPDGSGIAGDGIAIEQRLADCGGQKGLYSPSQRMVVLCYSPNSVSNLKPIPPDVDLETIAHEIGHAVESYALRWQTGDLSGFARTLESEAISESIADVLASCVSAGVNNPDDWLLFDQAESPYWRSLSKPKFFKMPDTLEGTYWAEAVGSKDYHAMGSVANHWFYLLAHGGSGQNDLGVAYQVMPIGRETALSIVMYALLNKLTAETSFVDYADQTIAAAGEMNGGSPEAQQAAEEAWVAAGVIDRPPPDPFLSPRRGSIGVLAWPVDISFKTPISGCDNNCESQWLVQLATKPDFSDAVNANAKQVTYGQTIASLRKDLHAGTPYYWRVKAMRRGVLDARWAWSSSFMTSWMVPQNLSPAAGDTDVHPWGAPLRWDVVPGAKSYQVLVAKNSELTDRPLSDTPKENKSDKLALISDTRYFWSVRAIGPNSWDGAWATEYNGKGRVVGSPDDLDRDWNPDDTIDFETNKPDIEFVTPNKGAPMYPWYADFHWKEVVGAKDYEIQVAPTGSTDFTTPQYREIVHADELEAHVNLSAELNKKYYWRVQAIGPNNDRSSFSNENDAETQYFVMDPSTLPKIVAPLEGALVDPAHLTMGWNQDAVYRAEQHRVMLYRPDLGTNQLLGDWWIFVHPDPPFQGDAVAYPGTLIADHEYFWTIQAIGPEWKTGPLLTTHFKTANPTPTPRPTTTPWPCNTVAVAGTDQRDERVFSLGKTSGTLKLKYKTYNIPDQIEVFIGSNSILTTWCVSTPMVSQYIDDAPYVEKQAPYSGGSQVKVIVSPNCLYIGDTKWQYEVVCP